MVQGIIFVVQAGCIIKITNNCNMGCSYCYYRHNKSSNSDNVMSKNILTSCVEFMLNNNDSCANFIWHGGEPLLMGREYFNEIVYLQNKLNDNSLAISNCIQTNGLLLNSGWIDFFLNNNFRLSISMDGPADLHCDGRNIDEDKFFIICNNVKRAVKLGLDPSLLCVVREESVGREKEIFDTFTSLGVTNFGFLPMNYGNLNDCISAQSYAKFLVNMFDVWTSSGKENIKIREFEDILRGIYNKGSKLCTRCNLCKYYFTVVPNGNAFACDTFPQNSQFYLGNIVLDSYENIFKNNESIFMKSEHLPEGCLHCKYKIICNGGCKYFRWISGEDFKNKQFYCETDKRVISHIIKEIKKLD